MRKIVVATTQMTCSANIDENIMNAEKNVREAVKLGANVVALQELFETEYFCKQHKAEYFGLATTLEENKAVSHFKKIAKELDVVIPVCFFEKSINCYYNSLAMIDADGEVLGIYRKNHIPDGLPYGEKFYFKPGDLGYKVFDTKYAKIGIGICWDQWFPECARALALQGAELIIYPTAIGSEPYAPHIDSKQHWQNCMCGHAAANIVPVVASNRIGVETDVLTIQFHGSSFITDHLGNVVCEADRDSNSVMTATFDLDEIAKHRSFWGVFRDRRPETYH